MMKSLFSISIRTLLILLKFIFIILLSKLSNVENVGVYALLASSLTLLVFFSGAELHSSACRNIVIESSKVNRQIIFTTHSIFVFFTLFASLAIYIILSNLGLLSDWPWLTYSFIMLCFFELYSQEIGRYLLMMKMPIASNTLQLIKGGGWVLPALYIISTEDESEHIRIVLHFWLSASAFSVLIGLVLLKPKLFFSKNVDFSWLKKALVEARVYWYIAILAQVQMYADRFMLNYFRGAQEVGILSMFQNFTNVVQTFVQVGVIGIFLPKLIEEYHKNNHEGLKKTIFTICKHTLLLIATISLLLIIFIDLVLLLINKEVYFQFIRVFYLQLVSSIFLTLSLIPHIVLYSMRKDNSLFKIAIKSLPFYLVLLAFLTSEFGIYGVVYSTILYNFILLSVKSKITLILLKGN